MAKVLRLHASDPVAVALDDLAAGTATGLDGVKTRGDIPRGHKVALRAIKEGEPVRKLGTVIGIASRAIAAGDHVHVHNLVFRPVKRGEPSLREDGIKRAFARVEGAFDGYVRPDGRVGTRNHLAVMATVNCSATVVKAIAARFAQMIDTANLPNFDGVIALTHEHGCSVRADGPGMRTLRRTLKGYAEHPNVAATLVIGLGCEDNQIESFLSETGLVRTPRLKALVIQEEGGTSATVDQGVKALTDMLPLALAARRESASLRHLAVGLQCGGSDGFSALTANPALGAAADRIVAAGGTVILSETPEIYGAESMLLDRAAAPEVSAKLTQLLDWWEKESARDGGSLDSNPSTGNRAGGITTIIEKALGAVAKGGTSPVAAIRDYAEPVGANGLVFMDSPGYDPVSATGQVAAGANVVCFTTGRGSCFGAKGAPSLKLATNTPLFRRMTGDMDLNCGEIAEGTATIDEVGARIFDLVRETASGRKTKSEALGYGGEEFIPWVPGLTY
jgi:altronate hydrolase